MSTMAEAAHSAESDRPKIRTRRGKILGWHWSVFYWDGMYRVHWWRQSDGEAGS